MLKRLVLLTAFATACGPADMNPLEPGQPQVKSGDPLAAGTVDFLERFDRAPFMEQGTGAVVAVTPDGKIHAAAIDTATQWPHIGANATALPGERGASDALALLADSQGALHAVWNRDGEILYARLNANTYEGEVQVLGRGSEPNVALGDAGRVVVSFISWSSNREVGTWPLVMVVEGRDGVFEAPVVTQAEPAWAVPESNPTLSGASMAIDAQGDVHLVYEWMLWSSTVVEYIRTVDGTWSEPVEVAAAAFSPCPDLALDSDGRAHIVYLLEGNDAVMYVVIDNNQISDPFAFPSNGEYFRMAKIAIDDSDAPHLIIDSTTVRQSVHLRYVGLFQQRGRYQVDISNDNIGAALRLTPRAGGALITTGGELLVPFVRSGSARIPSGTLELATGIKVTRS